MNSCPSIAPRWGLSDVGAGGLSSTGLRPRLISDTAARLRRAGAASVGLSTVVDRFRSDSGITWSICSSAKVIGDAQYTQRSSCERQIAARVLVLICWVAIPPLILRS